MFEPMVGELKQIGNRTFKHAIEVIKFEGRQYTYRICRVNKHRWLIQRDSVRDGASELAVWSPKYLADKIQGSDYMPYTQFLRHAMTLRWQ